MKNFARAALWATTMATVSATTQAQTVSSVIPGSPSNITGIQEQVSASEMTGLRIKATLEDGTFGYGVWGFGQGSLAGQWGADIWTGASHTGTRIASITMNPGTTDTYFGDWIGTMFQHSNLTTLEFEGGAGNGGVLFDRTFPLPGTNGSSLGRDFDMNAQWTGITATYTDVVTLNDAAAVGDLFTRVTVDYTNAKYCSSLFIICWSGWNADVPDLNGPGNPMTMYMDTDLGTFAGGIVVDQSVVTPEPSTYALMAAGLAALGMLARRRRQGNVA